MGEARRRMEAISSGAVEACGNCRFFWAPAQNCRRAHPIAILVGMKPSVMAGQAPQPIVGSYFPQSRPDGWCGEYERGAVPLPTAEQIAGALAGVEVEGTA